MKPRQKRLAMIAGGLVALGVAAAFVLAAFRENLVFFFTPTQVEAKEVPQGRAFRIGGLVVPGIPAFIQTARRVHHLQAGSAGDRQIGRKLWRLLAEAGYDHLGLDVLAFHSDELGLQAFLPQYDPERYRAFVDYAKPLVGKLPVVGSFDEMKTI